MVARVKSEARQKRRKQIDRKSIKEKHDAVAALDAAPHSRGDAAPRFSQWEVFSAGWQLGCGYAANAARVSVETVGAATPQHELGNSPCWHSRGVWCLGARALSARRTPAVLASAS
jgi:hypothetical protein